MLTRGAHCKNIITIDVTHTYTYTYTHASSLLFLLVLSNTHTVRKLPQGVLSTDGAAACGGHWIQRRYALRHSHRLHMPKRCSRERGGGGRGHGSCCCHACSGCGGGAGGRERWRGGGGRPAGRSCWRGSGFSHRTPRHAQQAARHGNAVPGARQRRRSSRTLEELQQGYRILD